MARARYIIAIDGDKAYLRRTLCVTHVTHDGVTGEGRYVTKPVRHVLAPKHIQNIYFAVQREMAKRSNAI